MKKGKLIRKFIYIILFSFIISACSFQKDVNVNSVEIIKETVPEFILAGEFDDAGIKALVTYEDGTNETIAIDSNILKDSYQEQLNRPGEYEIEVLLKGETVKLKVKIVENNVVHEVKFFNGYNELISMQLVKNGEDAVEPVGESRQIKGYNFIGWDRTFKNIKEDINIYAIYTKIEETQGSSVSLENILLGSVTNMQSEDFNVLYISELSSKRVEETHYNSNLQLNQIVQKVTKEDRNIDYYRYFKELKSNGIVSYFREQYDSNEDYLKINISDMEFLQNDIYGEIKKIITSANGSESSVILSKSKILYELTIYIYNQGDGNHISDTYEFIFNEKQIISLKHYQNFASSNYEALEKKLIDSKYYSVNLEKDEKLTFPSLISTENIANKFLKGYITTQKTTLETEHFIVQIDANVYVPAYLLEYVEVIYDTLEIVSGLEFYNQHYNPGKIIIEVGKVNNENSPETEHAGAYAYSSGSRIHVSSGDVLLGNSYAIVHELSHILMYSQSTWSYSKVFVEGFAEYNSYKAVQYLEKYNMDVAKTIETSKAQVGNMSIHGNIYSQTIKYWIENPSQAYDISGNGAYSVGFRFMSYLDHKYDDYSSWIAYYEQKNPYYAKEGYYNQEIAVQEQYNSMTIAYGSNVFDEFYSWLKINESILFVDPWSEECHPYDLTTLKYTYIYPLFVYRDDSTTMTKYYKFSYNDLYVGIDEARNYLQNYKNKDVTNLRMKLSKSVMVELYDSNNNLLESKIDDEFSLVGVSYIKLVGEGLLGERRIHGLEILY